MGNRERTVGAAGAARSDAEPARARFAVVLHEAATFRALSLALRTPTHDLGAKLRELADSVEPGHAPAFRKVAALATPDIESEYHRLLGAGGHCPAVESAYCTPAIGGSGGILADIAGFYAAFGFDPTAEVRDAPDHVSVELSFCAWLCMKEAYALDSNRSEAAAVCREALSKFRADHLNRWLGAYCASLESAANERFYAAAARLMHKSIPSPNSMRIPA